MPKRKSPSERRVWARMVGPVWEVHLANGEVLVPVAALTKVDARERSARVPVFRISYGSSERDLTGDRPAIESDLAQPDVDGGGYEYKSYSLFRGDRGTEAVIIEHHH